MTGHFSVHSLIEQSLQFPLGRSRQERHYPKSAHFRLLKGTDLAQRNQRVVLPQVFLQQIVYEGTEHELRREWARFPVALDERCHVRVEVQQVQEDLDGTFTPTVLGVYPTEQKKVIAALLFGVSVTCKLLSVRSVHDKPKKCSQRGQQDQRLEVVPDKLKYAP